MSNALGPVRRADWAWLVFARIVRKIVIDAGAGIQRNGNTFRQQTADRPGFFFQSMTDYGCVDVKLAVYASLLRLERRNKMKKIATLAVVLGLTAGASFAGGYSAPAVEAEPMVAAGASSSGGGLLIPAILLLGLAAASSSGT